MAIIATCLCGAQFKVPDAEAGEQMTCPMCATMVLVPSLDIGKMEDEERKEAPAPRHICPDCKEEFTADQMVDDQGELVCRRCFEHGPPKVEMPLKTKKLILVLAGFIFLLILNIFFAYILWG